MFKERNSKKNNEKRDLHVRLLLAYYWALLQDKNYQEKRHHNEEGIGD